MPLVTLVIVVLLCRFCHNTNSGQFLLYDIGRRALGVASDDLKLYLDVLGSTFGTQQ
jgi:hypothetical protein